MDLFNREIVAHSISRNPSFAQTREMLTRLFAKLPPTARPLLHSDQGWQYQMKEYQTNTRQRRFQFFLSFLMNLIDITRKSDILNTTVVRPHRLEA